MTTGFEQPLVTGQTLPETPRDLFKLRPLQWLVYSGLIALCRMTGWWKHSVPAEGDFARMKPMDKVYWLYKASYPITRPRRGLGIEAHFARQLEHRWELPAAFEVRNELRLTAVGDLINHAYLANSGATLYREVADLIFGADVSMANLECPVFDQAEGVFVFDPNAPPPLFYDQLNFGKAKGFGDKSFTFMAAACNHSLDFGAKGVDSTIRVLTAEGILFSGVNATEADSDRATLIERNGFKIGIVSYTFGTNAHQPPRDRPRIVNLMQLNDGVSSNDFSQLAEQLNDCAAQGVEFIIAHLHWGMEHELYPTPEQIELAHHLAELGVDAIIGHHPHVVQPTEYYRTQRDPLRIVPIFYSLGNLINFFSAPHLCKSSVAKLTLARGKLADGSDRVYVKHTAQIDVLQQVDHRQETLRLTKA